MDFFDSFLSLGRQALIIGAFALVGAAITAVIKRTKLVRLEAAAGHTMMGGMTFLLVAMLIAFTIAIIVTGILQWEYTAPQLGVWLVLALISGGAAVAFSLCAGCRWRWDAEGVTYTDVFKSETIRWSDFDVASADWSNLFRLQTTDGRKIYWSKYTIGWRLLHEAVELYRPDLAPMLDYKRRLSA